MWTSFLAGEKRKQSFEQAIDNKKSEQFKEKNRSQELIEEGDGCCTWRP